MLEYFLYFYEKWKYCHEIWRLKPWPIETFNNLSYSLVLCDSSVFRDPHFRKYCSTKFFSHATFYSNRPFRPRACLLARSNFSPRRYRVTRQFLTKCQDCTVAPEHLTLRIIENKSEPFCWVQVSGNSTGVFQ